MCPPPLCHTVILPALFRPPRFRNPTVNRFSGRPRHSIDRDVVIRPRCPGDVGLYAFIVSPTARVAYARVPSHAVAPVPGTALDIARDVIVVAGLRAARATPANARARRTASISIAVAAIPRIPST